MLLCSLLVSVVYATVRVKRMAREEHLVEHMRVEVAEEECLGALNQWWIPQSKLHTQFDQVFSHSQPTELLIIGLQCTVVYSCTLVFMICFLCLGPGFGQAA